MNTHWEVRGWPAVEPLHFDLHGLHFTTRFLTLVYIFEHITALTLNFYHGVHFSTFIIQTLLINNDEQIIVHVHKEIHTMLYNNLFPLL